MLKNKQEDLVSPPLMFAFRHAHAKRDGKLRLDPNDRRADPSYLEGERKVVAQRNAARLAVTVSLLRREVGTDLEQLMNTIALGSTEDLRAYEHVRKSILNFGCPDIVHRTIDEFDVGDIAAEITEALIRYEPRLISNSVRVRRDDSANSTELKVRFVVVAQLRWNPVNVPVEFLADVEVDSGKIALSRV